MPEHPEEWKQENIANTTGLVFKWMPRRQVQNLNRHTQKFMAIREMQLAVWRHPLVRGHQEVLMKESPVSRGQGQSTLAPTTIVAVKKDFSALFTLLPWSYWNEIVFMTHIFQMTLHYLTVTRKVMGSAVHLLKDRGNIGWTEWVLTGYTVFKRIILLSDCILRVFLVQWTGSTIGLYKNIHITKQIPYFVGFILLNRAQQYQKIP